MSQSCVTNTRSHEAPKRDFAQALLFFLGRGVFPPVLEGVVLPEAFGVFEAEEDFDPIVAP